jgi:hypothetical protein
MRSFLITVKLSSWEATSFIFLVQFFGVRIFRQKIRFNCLPQLKSVLKSLLFVFRCCQSNRLCSSQCYDDWQAGKYFGSGRGPNEFLCRDLPGMSEEYDGQFRWEFLASQQRTKLDTFWVQVWIIPVTQTVPLLLVLLPILYINEPWNLLIKTAKHFS